jgi:hypothetical protein
VDTGVVVTAGDVAERGWLMTRWASLVAAVEALLLGWLVVDSYDPGGGFDIGIPLFLATSVAVGWTLGARAGGHPIGWLFLVIAGFFLLGVPAGELGLGLVDSAPAVAAWLLWYGGDRETVWIWLPPIGLLFTQVLLLFPDGRLPSPGWRWFQRFAIATLVVGTATFMMIRGEVAPGLPSPIGWIDPENSALAIAVFLPLLASFVGSAASLVWRYRHADLVTRQQIKWVVLAAAFAVGLYVVTLPLDVPVLYALVSAAYSLIPVSIAVAILRYRLYEIDRIVSRTVSWALVTLLAAGTYAVAVTLVSRLLTGSSALAVAAATLAAAAVFRPALGRVQHQVDRRFDRARFDAAREVDAYATALRTTVDPEVVVTELGDSLQRTLAPSAMGVWLARDPS